jgi:proline dehydrogenase
MYRNALLLVSLNPLSRFMVTRTSLMKRFVQRFVAGEGLTDAIRATKEINARGCHATLDLLGESVKDLEQAARATAAYVEILDRIAAERVDSNISIKLSALGLDVSRDEAKKNLLKVLKAAEKHRIFVRIDMEDSSYTQRTLDMFREVFPEHPEVGVVMQAYLFRTEKDVEALVKERVRVRLCKGAYREPPDISFPRKADTDANFGKLMKTLLAEGNYPGIATHDEHLVDATLEFVKAKGITKERFEFQMLYGIREDLQVKLAKAGFNVRVYVPYGSEWYAYFMRRLAEHPANLKFFVFQTIRR